MTSGPGTPTLDQLHVLIEVAKAGSFTEIAGMLQGVEGELARTGCISSRARSLICCCVRLGTALHKLANKRQHG